MFRKLIGVAIFSTISLAASATGSPPVMVWVSHSLDLGNTPHALRVDSSRNVIYVSVPDSNRVFIVDPTSMAISNEIFVGFHPYGIDLSADDNTLYAALNQAGSVGIYDLANNSLQQADISVPLGSSLTWDVAETSPGIVFATANPYDFGFAYIVRLDVKNGTSAVVASNTIIRASPIFGKDPTGKALYIGEGFDPNSLYKLDITQASAPLAATAPFAELGNTDISLAVNPAGTQLIMGDGEIVRTNELTEDGTVGPGVALFSDDGSLVISATGNAPIAINVFDATTLDQVESIPTDCAFQADFQPVPQAIQAMPSSNGWAVIGGTILCVVEQVPDAIFADGFD